ncbi:MAG TPA: sigma-70 family RNA polymerase sigma factor [Pyrinomonadaceae bacterium]|nr:sigma-70 family RNA polymerase sigma factor [Pyrinomonadaceae bacterium]
MSSEDELIRLAQSGDTNAFCLLAEAYERRIFSLAFHYCRERQDAEDLSQEVWLRAYAALPGFRFESTFYTWLRKITINCFLNYRRARSSRQSETLESAEIAESHTTLHNGGALVGFESTLQNRLVVEKVMQALAGVSPQQRLIFLLKHQEGMTYAEISKELGCSLGTVKKSISRTVAKLREKLQVVEEPENYISSAATGILR